MPAGCRSPSSAASSRSRRSMPQSGGSWAQGPARPVRRSLSSYRRRAGAARPDADASRPGSRRRAALDRAADQPGRSAAVAGCEAAYRGDRAARRCSRRHARSLGGAGRAEHGHDPRGPARGAAGSAISHAPGVAIEGGEAGGIGAALDLARAADVVVLCLGEARRMSGEAASRARPDLPGHQPELAQAVLDLGKPVVVLLSSGRPLMAPWLFERAQAVLATWFLGSEAGHAIGDVVSGRYNLRAGCPSPGRSTSGRSRSSMRGGRAAGPQTRKCITPASIWIFRSTRCSRSGTACPTAASWLAVCASAPRARSRTGTVGRSRGRQ